MQLSAKIINKSVTWSALLKPRAGTIVNNNGSFYANISGINSVVSNAANWFLVYSQPLAGPVTIDKTAADITGTDPDYKINLSADSIPVFPVALKVYVKINTSPGTKYELVEPVNFEPETSTLSGMNSPTDFPNQLIKIVVM